MTEGYKQTEIGVLPEDWEVVSLKQVYDITSSKRVFQSEWKDSGVPFYRAREIAVMSEGKVAPRDLFISVEMYNAYVKQYGAISENDILITGVGTLGKVYVVKDTDQFYFKDGNIIWLQWNGKCCSNYIKHLYDTPLLQRQVHENAGGSTVGTYTITNAKDTLIPFPPLPEQRRIAEALSDVDELIASLEKLIAKKKAIKQGAMQELLTGKCRLPGFSGEWQQNKIGALCEIVNGGTPSTIVADYWNGSIPWCTPTDITLCKSKYMGETANKITDKGLRYSSANLLPPGAILLCSRATIGEARIAVCPICTNQGFKSLIVHSDIDNEWLYYRVLTLKQDMMEKAIGSTFLEISKNALSGIPITVPKYEEQSAISQVLSDIDVELERLEVKLNGIRQIKQGMMQQLLTGKTRLQ